MKLREIEDVLFCGLIKGAGFFLKLFPVPLALRFAAHAGRAYAFIAKRRWIALDNLRRSLGGAISDAELKKILAGHFESLAQTIAEVLIFPSLTDAEILAHAETEGLERFDACMARGKGTIALVAHTGNWEFLCHVAPLMGYPLTAISQPQKFDRLEMFLNGQREKRGAEIIHRGNAAKLVIRRLGEKRLVALLVDQDAGPKGVFVDLFGRRSCRRGIGAIAQRTGASVIPVFDRRVGLGRHRTLIGNEITVPAAESGEDADGAVMTDFCRQLEAFVRANPDQWLWQHKRWKSSPRKRFLVFSDGKKGHEKQSDAFVKILFRIREKYGVSPLDSEREILKIVYRSGFRRRMLMIWGFLSGGRFPFAAAALKAVLTPESYRGFERGTADYAISCGSGAEPAARIFSRQRKIRLCLIQKPQFGQENNGIAIIPGHDRFSGGRGRVYRTKGAVSFCGDRDETPVCGEKPPSQENSFGFLVGGPSKRSGWSQKKIRDAVTQIKELWKETPFKIYVSSSRRTPDSTEALLREAFGSWAGCGLLATKKDADFSQKYETILEKSRFFLITADSISMISEALDRGKPVMTFAPDEKKDGKMESFLKRFKGEAYFRFLLPGEAGKELRSWIREAPEGPGSLNGEVLEEAALGFLGLDAPGKMPAVVRACQSG